MESACAKPIHSASDGLTASMLSTRRRRLRLSISRIKNAADDESRGHRHRREQIFFDRADENDAKTAAGRNASRNSSVKSCDLRSRGRVATTVQSRCRYSQQIARMAANWMTISNTSPFSSFQFEQAADDDQMPGAGNGQEFRQSFHDAENQRLDGDYEIHVSAVGLRSKKTPRPP